GVQTNQSESNDVGSFTTALFDRSSVSLNLSFNASLHALLRRDAMRVAVLTSLLCNGTSSLHLDSFGTDVVSAFIGGEYFVRVAVGTPPFSVELLVDTGSDLTWLQCQPCSHCYSQPGPIFDPRNSTTFQNVDCGMLCELLYKNNRGCQADRCTYHQMYGDGSYTEGNIALDSIILGNGKMVGMLLGCGHSNVIQSLYHFGGILGLGWGRMSIVDHISYRIGGVFSYCLATSTNPSPGWITFGSEAIAPGNFWIPLIRNEQAPTYYYVGLVGLGVGGTRLPISEEVFKLRNGNGGIAYEALRDAYLAQTSNIPRVPPVREFEVCYNLIGVKASQLPLITLHFDGGLVLSLMLENIFISADGIVALKILST
ncbi:hypothetical protein Tsubulata_012201, partial [Turnera subulata]